ncbi:MAG TPA: DUF2330 domain-containing protein [Candidatus Eisenbacteria bacterium]|nr:DUF2330 domain-containing protein [Candidatus Eisenbacteria bacterium]
MNRWTCALAIVSASLLSAPAAHSFCGFYVARGDAKLFNKASKVVLVRDEDHTVLTMASDFKGEPEEFALVVPVPTVLEKGQIHVGDPKAVDHLDAYTAPRLVEYFDPDPCRVYAMEKMSALRNAAPMAAGQAAGDARLDRSLGVRVEARYTVGEYDILILSAKESGGLETWLRIHDYRVPPGASRVLASYLRQGMKFFVARVNLAEQAKLGYSYLRPLQMAFDSPKFMLPLRLGMVNADGPQELFVYALTRNGRVETTNYRTVRLPSDAEIPEFVKEDFPRFYKDMFAEQHEHAGGDAVFLEYAWDMAWCDPCAADPMSREELAGLGVFWINTGIVPPGRRGGPGIAPQFMPPPGNPQEVFVTRLHVRYDAAHFPEDLVFQETGDKTSFQGRFVIRHPFRGQGECEAMRAYRGQVRERRAKEAETLADLTGWSMRRIHQRMGGDAEWSSAPGPAPGEGRKWWDWMWKK